MTFVDYVVEPEVTPLRTAELDAVEADLKSEMAKLAYGTLSHDEATLAYAAIVESAFYWKGWRSTLKEDSLEAVLDNIIARYPDDRACSHAGIQAAMRARRWWIPGSDFSDLASAIINVRLNRMRACRAKSGMILFHPTSDATTELRNRWFDVSHFRRRESAGVGLIQDSPKTRLLVAKIDRHFADQDCLNTTVYVPPLTERWYQEHCDVIANRVLSGQFAHVDVGEVWGGMNRQQIIAAVRTLYRRAALRLVGHQRAFKIIAEQFGKPQAVLRSTVEVVELDQLSRDVAKSASLNEPDARRFVESLVRRGRGEKHKVAAYPLLPMHGSRVLLVPSIVLFSNWPASREQATARGPIAPSQIGDARNSRYMGRAVELLRKCGFNLVETEIELHRSDKTTLTDLDVVAVTPSGTDVLVLQLKSFVTPGNLLDLRRADSNVEDAVEQCSRADGNLSITKVEIEKRFQISLVATWKLHQLIVVEANIGTKPLPAAYPAVTLEWLEAQVVNGISPDPGVIWTRARDLPDAADFMSSLVPLFMLYGETPRGLKLPSRAAVFNYRGETYSAREFTPDEKDD